MGSGAKAGAVFDGGVGTPTGLSSRTLVLLLLPVFLWGAVRFGPVGISASLLAVSTLAVWGAQLGRGPFATVPADERVLLLQVSSIMVTIPLLGVAAVVAERRDSARALRESLHFEKLISELSSACVRLPPERLDEVVTTGAYLDATQEVLHKHGGLWFNDETFVVTRRQK